jgi:hypothetical protein
LYKYTVSQTEHGNLNSVETARQTKCLLEYQSLWSQDNQSKKKSKITIFFFAYFFVIYYNIFVVLYYERNINTKKMEKQ